MPRQIDLIRRSALPSHKMMTAAKGALAVPAEEMVEILVYLAENNKIFGEQARVTLAGWDEASSKAIASNPATPKEVLDYWLSPKNLRASLFALLLENPSVSANKLSLLGATLKGEWIDAMLASPRARGARVILTEMATNKELSGVQTARLQELLTGKPAVSAAAEPTSEPTPANTPQPETPKPQTAQEQASANEPSGESAVQEPETADPETDGAVAAFLKEHATELAAEGEKPFQPLGGIYEEISEPEPEVAAAAAAASASPATAPQNRPGAKAAPKKIVNPQDEQRGSVLQKIARLDVKGRIQLGMKGTKEERSILVRDGTKVVALAVLDSPKITDGEVEKFAGQKNVLEAVLRAIPMKRRFAKNYAVVRNLVANPRTPLDVGLGLMKNLLVQDLKNLSGNKEVSETIRKLALRMFKQKMETANKG